MLVLNDTNPEATGLAGDLLWEVAPIAHAIGRTPRQTHYLLSKGVLPAKKVGGRWVSSRKALAAFLTKVSEVA